MLRMRARHLLTVLAGVACGCSFPVDTFEVVDASAKDANTGASDTGPSGDAALTCSGATPDLCDGRCTNIKSDPKNCGRCGKVCQSDQKCQSTGDTSRCN